MMLLNFPTLIIVVVLYNLLIFAGDASLGTTIFSQTMISGTTWTLSLSDVLIVFALFLLFIEILKSTRTGPGSIVDHLLSTVLFIVCLVEFLTVQEAATSTFFLITVITLIDVVAGYSVTISSARRDFAVGPGNGPY